MKHPTGNLNVRYWVNKITYRAFAPIRSSTRSIHGHDSDGDRLTRDTQRVRVRLNGERLVATIRRGTTDHDLVRMILHRDGIYRLPSPVVPEVIFDIGANIGIASMYYATIYPEAKIYSFEPLPENLELLRKNVAVFGERVRVLPYGVSDRSGSFDYFMSNNPRSFGGGGFSQIGHDPKRKRTLPIRTVSEVMRDLGVSKIDVLKIDTEGSELSILRGVPAEAREQSQVILGELHGIGDWEFLRTLSGSHAIELNKPFDRSCFPFLGLRKDLVDVCTQDPSASGIAA